MQFQEQAATGHVLMVAVGGTPVPDMTEFLGQSSSIPIRMIVQQALNKLDIGNRNRASLTGHEYLHDQ